VLIRRLFAALLEKVRRASERVRAAIVVTLLAIVYVLVLPWFALFKRISGPRPSGWVLRDEPDVARLERLRQPF
jgi:hypothetical protein